MHVKGAVEQLIDLRQTVRGCPPVGAQLDPPLLVGAGRREGEQRHGRGRQPRQPFNQVNLLYGSKRISQPVAQALIVDATRVEGVIGKLVLAPVAV